MASLLAITLLLFACSSLPPPALKLPTSVTKLKYLGEITGRLGGEPLQSPQAICFDPAGNMYIVDEGNSRIVKLSSNFDFIAENGGFGSELGGLNRPLDITTSGGINFFILDQGNRRIIRSDYNLVFADQIDFDDSPELMSLGQVEAIAVSRYGELYLLDPDNLRVLVLDSDYAFDRELVAAGGFSHCSRVGVASSGVIYIYDRDENIIYHFNSFGNLDGKFALADAGVFGGLVATENYLIATDSRRNELVLFDHQGNRLLAVGSHGSGPYNLNSPTGIALRFDGKLFVCDSGNNRIVYYEIISD